MHLPITYLFVPGDRPDRFDKALDAGADAVILDLEDAVPAAAKASARAAIAQWIATRPHLDQRVALRINAASTSAFDADLALLSALRIRLAILPKAETPAQIARVTASLPPNGCVLPLIETARGVHNVDAIALAPGVQRLALGTLDYAVDLDLSGDERGLVYPGSRLAIASRCADLDTPIAGVTSAIDDEQQLRDDVAFARALGFGAKLCIHPRQVAVVRHALLPTPADLEWARRVIVAAEGQEGAVQLDGRMVDRPILLRAQAIVDRSQHANRPSAPSQRL
jgi:citrate lyase subunit beta/citryl-CoA lyase